MPNPPISARRSPYYSNAIGSAAFTIGAETNNTRTVSVQLKDVRGNNVAVRCKTRAYLAGDSAGATLATSVPQRVVAGTNGLVRCVAAGDDALLTKGSLAIDAVPEKFKTTATAIYRIGGVQYSKAAATAIVFSAAHVVAAAKYGVVLVQVNAAGTVSTKVPASPQTYASAALALAALPQPDAGNAALGYITLDNSASDGSTAGAWTAQTDDLTNTSDITAAAFVDGTELNGPRVLDLVSNASGQVDVVIAETGVKTYYLVLELPDGTVVVSGAISFT